MNDKERLEHYKLMFVNKAVLSMEDVEDIQEAGNWLIKQAEKVEQLELEINDWRAEVQKWQKFYKKSEESHLETKELLNSIVNQNKRYRVALENICVSPFRLDIDEAVTIAKQALEGEE
jgi:hypothetical protein